MVGRPYSPPNPEHRVDWPTWEREVTPLLERLAAHDAEVAAAAIAVIRRTLPSYRNVPADALQSSAHRNSHNAIRTLAERRLPSEFDLSGAAVAARDRARQGVPVHEALTAYRMSVHEIREFLTEAARQAGSSPAVILEMTQLLWALADAVSVRMASAHQDTQLEIARHDDRQRAEFLRGLVFGSLGAAEIRRLGPAYDLSLDTQYLAVRGRPAPGTSSGELIRALSAPARAVGRHPFFDVLEGEVFGVTPVMPGNGACPGTVGVGPLAHLAVIESSFATASRVLEVAERFGEVGVFRLQDLSLRVAVAAEDELGEILVQRYLQPLAAVAGRGDDIRATVAVYIDEGLNPKSTAQRLNVHQNTVRYRIARFEELTGAHLDHPYTAFEVWWALQRGWIKAQTETDASEVRPG